MLSLIIPVYNGEEYLHRCLETILLQGCNDLEVLFVDDGSTDGSSRILNEMKSEYDWIRVIEQVNSGVSAARNRGISEAKGEYLAFLDCDDELYPDALNFMMNEAKKSNADMVCCATEFRSASRSTYEFGTNNRYEYSSLEARIQYLLGGKITISAWNKLFKRETIGNIRFNEDIAIHEDKLFVYECLCQADRVVVEDKPMYVYYQNESSTCHVQMTAKWFDVMKVLDVIDNQIDEEAAEEKDALILNRFNTHKYLYRKMSREPSFMKSHIEKSTAYKEKC